MRFKFLGGGLASVIPFNGDNTRFSEAKKLEPVNFRVDVGPQLRDTDVRGYKQSAKQNGALNKANKYSSDADLENVVIRRALLLIGSVIGGVALSLLGCFQ